MRKRKAKVISFGLLCHWADTVPILPVHVEYRQEDVAAGRWSGTKTARHFQFDMLTEEECAGYETDWRCWTIKPTPERVAEVPWKEG